MVPFFLLFSFDKGPWAKDTTAKPICEVGVGPEQFGMCIAATLNSDSKNLGRINSDVNRRPTDARRRYAKERLRQKA